tara:strand:- start:10464 stop:10949 length:486 start_codon:yes stop_codon:yes gene_type:complete
MENIHGRFIDVLTEAEELWRSADHLVYITMPVVQDEKLLIRALENLHKSLVLAISTILKFEYLYKRVDLGKDTRKNLDMFFGKCAVRYGLNEKDCELIREIMFLGKKHKESGFEFSKKGKVVILDDSLKTSELDTEKVKSFLSLGKRLLEESNRNFKSSFG